MYKNMRDELLKEESKAKTEAQKQKIDDLNARLAALDLAKKEREERERQAELEQQQHRQAAEAKKNAGTKSLLDNIKSFDVEDI